MRPLIIAAVGEAQSSDSRGPRWQDSQSRGSVRPAAAKDGGVEEVNKQV